MRRYLAGVAIQNNHVIDLTKKSGDDSGHLLESDGEILIKTNFIEKKLVTLKTKLNKPYKTQWVRYVACEKVLTITKLTRLKIIRIMLTLMGREKR